MRNNCNWGQWVVPLTYGECLTPMQQIAWMIKNYPQVDIERIENGVKITVTDYEGEQNEIVYDGQDAAQLLEGDSQTNTYEWDYNGGDPTETITIGDIVERTLTKCRLILNKFRRIIHDESGTTSDTTEDIGMSIKTTIDGQDYTTPIIKSDCKYYDSVAEETVDVATIDTITATPNTATLESETPEVANVNFEGYTPEGGRKSLKLTNGFNTRPGGVKSIKQIARGITSEQVGNPVTIPISALINSSMLADLKNGLGEKNGVTLDLDIYYFAQTVSESHFWVVTLCAANGSTINNSGYASQNKSLWATDGFYLYTHISIPVNATRDKYEGAYLKIEDSSFSDYQFEADDEIDIEATLNVQGVLKD